MRMLLFAVGFGFAEEEDQAGLMASVAELC